MGSAGPQTRRVISPRSLARSLAQKVGLRLAPLRPDLVAFLASRKVTTLFDVGANTGQFGESLRKKGYCGRIVSFEPIREAFEHLAAKAAQDALWTVHNCALGQTAGVATINVSVASDFSSLLSQRHTAIEHAAHAANVRTECIAVERLDGFFAGFEGERCFLKIDAQGYESQVIAGADHAMRHLLGIQMELPVIHLYENVWTLSQAVDHMAGLGFVMCQVDPVSYHSLDRCAVIELDCIFRRRSELD
jgi:FkbM family methyltransferase